MSPRKRIIVCCDGTGQNGIEKKYRWQYSNVLKLARAFHQEGSDPHSGTPIQQIVFYQAGVGTDKSLLSRFLGGVAGDGVIEHVQDAYTFIAHNYMRGDEIFLIGFSRGAYTVRMVADFIGAVGVLLKEDMDRFAEIFLDYKMMGNAKTEKERKEYADKIKHFTDQSSRGRLNAEANRSFSIECLAVFDTVAAIGAPVEIVGDAPKTQLFGFNDDFKLGSHIKRALQALALNERREDFKPAIWSQTDKGKKKGQVLHQCWFTGAHSDIGGSYLYRDLSDISLAWMVANLEDIIAVDMEEINKSLEGRHHERYGEMIPHDSSTGIYIFAKKRVRPLPTPMNVTTLETIHPSALKSKYPGPDLIERVNANPDILWKLKPFEEHIEAAWTSDPDHTPKSKDGKIAALMEWLAQGSYLMKYIFWIKMAQLRMAGTVTRNRTIVKSGVAVKRDSVQAMPEPTPFLFRDIFE